MKENMRWHERTEIWKTEKERQRTDKNEEDKWAIETNERKMRGKCLFVWMKCVCATNTASREALLKRGQWLKSQKGHRKILRVGNLISPFGRRAGRWPQHTSSFPFFKVLICLRNHCLLLCCAANSPWHAAPGARGSSIWTEQEKSDHHSQLFTTTTAKTTKTAKTKPASE